ncbi:hypothetical protein Lesp02_42350 [Lentzea sp. NBRC 105346]|uniref:GAF and ANTAR domain-containing protein n=1 Tax=Lentzea sp. NBRC 105346 TaxID=3032205 RepID=UPI0024A195E2|nr:GAF and ANTAR domain-containing protein [Lentzea sp. NBRC 105346]GLZ32047.1 hypothetical protein Lesp02_42350 [Lentzea sp. NBRC 105346]
MRSQPPVPPPHPVLRRPEALSERGIDEILNHVVHELYASGLDLHTVLALLGLPGEHRQRTEDRVRAVINRLDDAISTVHHAGARLASARTATIDPPITSRTGLDLPGYLHDLARHCVELLGIDAAAIVLVDQDVMIEMAAAATTGLDADVAWELCQLADGPCRDTCGDGQPVTVGDLAATSRWPLFTAQARTAGFQAIHTVPLGVVGTPLGALALFRTTTHEPSANDVHLAETVASFAVVALTCDGMMRQRDSRAERLESALIVQAVAEQAKGVLAERHGISISAAQNVVATHSRLHDVHPIDTAQAIMDGTADLSDTVRSLR